MDEPFYAPFLAATGTAHPMRDEILRVHECDPEAVAALCLAPQATPHVYMKHMPHHMVAGFPMDWAHDCVNVHLIRHPARVIASYAAKWEDLTLEMIGYPQQLALFQQVGGVVIDSFDIRADPERSLNALCTAIDLPFDPSMLNWPAGARAQDGVWGAHWYGAVHRSTGFAGPEGEKPVLPPHLEELCDAALPYYEQLAALKISY